MAETPLHQRIMIDLIHVLKDRYADDPNVYVAGNMLMFYERGNRRKHVSPDVYAVFGVPKEPERWNYLIWEEGKGPDVVFEITSKTTRREDQTKKLTLYRDVIRVPEYFQFDPKGDYLKPPLQGFRLVEGQYIPIEPVNGRLPCECLGLELERDGEQLRLRDPDLAQWLPTRLERLTRAEAEIQRVEAARQAEADARFAAEAEVERLRRLLDALRHGPSNGP